MEKIAIICHAAGGAEIISNWAVAQNATFYFVLSGPAVSIFRKLFGDIKILKIEEAIKNSDWTLCGSSWNSDLEKKAVLYAKELKKKVIVFLDHWICYEERLTFKGKSNLPSQIWVTDNYAYNIAREIFKKISIINVGNQYLDNQILKIKKINKSDSDYKVSKILFVAENIREHAFLYHKDEKYWGYTEEEALIYFLDNIGKLKNRIEKITIRLHPSDKKGKYDWILNMKKYKNIFISSNKNELIYEINNCDLVVGCETMAMVLALHANKEVISCIPPKGRRCILPHKEIKYLNHLIKNL